MSSTNAKIDPESYESLRQELQDKLLSNLKTGTKRDNLIAGSWSLLEEAFNIELNRYKQKIDVLEQKLQCSEENKDNNNTKNDSFKHNTNDELKKKLEEMISSEKVLQNELNTKEQLINDKDEQIKHLTSTNESMINEFEKQAKDYESAIETKSKIINNQNEEIETRDKEIRDMKKQLKEYQSKPEQKYLVESKYDKVKDIDIVRWIPDDLVDKCEDCDSSFSMTNRKHHCRSCGRIICNSCSTTVKNFKYYSGSTCICKKCQNLI